MKSTDQQSSVRDLIAELARLEERIAAVRTFEDPQSPGASELNPELIELLQRESDVVAALRSRRPHG